MCRCPVRAPVLRGISKGTHRLLALGRQGSEATASPRKLEEGQDATARGVRLRVNRGREVGTLAPLAWEPAEPPVAKQ